MGDTISQRELRNDSGTIMRRVERGEILTVTRNGTPVADLVPHRPDRSGAARFVAVDVIAAGMSTLPAWDTAAFAREQQELDDVVDDHDRDAWVGR